MCHKSDSIRFAWYRKLPSSHRIPGKPLIYSFCKWNILNNTRRQFIIIIFLPLESITDISVLTQASLLRWWICQWQLDILNMMMVNFQKRFDSGHNDNDQDFHSGTVYWVKSANLSFPERCVCI